MKVSTEDVLGDNKENKSKDNLGVLSPASGLWSLKPGDGVGPLWAEGRASAVNNLMAFYPEIWISPLLSRY